MSFLETEPGKRNLATYLAPALMVLVGIVLELLASTPFYIPNPPAIFIVILVYAAIVGGEVAGLLSAGIAVLFIAETFRKPGALLAFTDADLRRVILWAIALPLTALLTGRLHRRAQSNKDSKDEAEELFRLTAENVPDLVLTVKRGGGIMYANRAAHAHYGAFPEEPNFFAFTDPVDSLKFREGVTGAFDHGTGTLFDQRNPKGLRRWWRYRIEPMFKDGLVYMATIIAHDVTEEHFAKEKLQMSDKRFAMIFEQSPFPIVTYLPDGQWTSANAAWEKMWGISLTQVPKDYNVRHDPLMASLGLSPAIERAFAGETVHTEAVHYDPGQNKLPGDARWMACTFFPVKTETGETGEVILLIQDVTHRVTFEQELEKYRKHLEELVNERTTQLQDVNHELEAFVYTASHDLQAPLRTIDGFAEALDTDYSDKLDAKAQDYLDRVRMASRRMTTLLGELLEFSRLSKREIVRKPVDLSAMAKEVADTLQKNDSGRAGVTFDIAAGMKAEGDADMLRIVLENLLGNAWKFTSKHAAAHITFGTRQQGGKTEYFVQDDGTGFDMTYVHKLFTPFQRLHLQDDFAGTGVGLASVRRIVTRHGGTVRAEGAPEKGATISFTLS